MRTEKKLKLKQLRHWRIRKNVSGTAERPRMPFPLLLGNKDRYS